MENAFPTDNSIPKPWVNTSETHLSFINSRTLHPNKTLRPRTPRVTPFVPPSLLNQNASLSSQAAPPQEAHEEGGAQHHQHEEVGHDAPVRVVHQPRDRTTTGWVRTSTKPKFLQRDWPTGCAEHNNLDPIRPSSFHHGTERDPPQDRIGDLRPWYRRDYHHRDQ